MGDLNNCLQVTDESIAEVAHNCKKLTTLDLFNCTQVTDVSIGEVARCCTQLTDVNLEGTLVTDNSVSLIMKNCEDVTEVREDDGNFEVKHSKGSIKVRGVNKLGDKSVKQI